MVENVRCRLFGHQRCEEFKDVPLRWRPSGRICRSFMDKVEVRPNSLLSGDWGFEKAGCTVFLWKSSSEVSERFIECGSRFMESLFVWVKELEEQEKKLGHPLDDSVELYAVERML
ncbi:hypothetical protein H6P81_008837 [Aristolochia fimbriata]|uniref:Uncharacterized protein n=1 Tax=Aristolochia fimbriata TaxID=158543 RepID=A0AAV7EMP0_ARIFI|nr:hypothetical protein H6P81_008837 [Aristolochia fimbriata]